MREFRFVITPFCNYRCFFCHRESACGQINLMLKPSDYIFLGQVGKNMGWSTVTITGGEPFISPIFNDVTEELKQLGIRITVVTNASLLAKPSEMLKNIEQVNISLHTMNPEVYRQITRVNYPLENILSTIATIRALMPELVIHLNYTVIKRMNDSNEEFEKVLRFGREVKAEVKFIDLSTTDMDIVTNADDIVKQLKELGFQIKNQDAWQYRLSRRDEVTRVTKCPFNGKHADLPTRDIFVDSDGTLYKSYGGYLAINALNEIKSRDEEHLRQKMKILF
ncbi:radical SAM protein [Candidatus Saccharibacteria bacterium]|nr:radical SAM protein [Candidatus Saccharibacteria bacterium]